MASIGDLEIAVEGLPQGGKHVRIAGELDLATVGELERVLEATDTSKPLVIDLTECSFLDSSAVRVLIQAANNAEGGGLVSVVAPSPGIRKTLEIARVDAMLPIHTALPDA
jgi:anti-sigma B factor antagonist